MAGITPFGFERKTLQEIYASLQQRFKSKLGNNWNTTDGSVEQQFIGVFAEELDQAWQGAEGVYSSQTLDGAEGIYLDDVLSKNGVFREGKKPSSGNAILLSDASVLTIGSVLSQTTQFSALNNITYIPTTVVSFDNSMDCYRLSHSQLVVGQSYTFNIYSLDAPTVASFTWLVGDDLDKNNMLSALAEYINNTVINPPFAAYYDPISRTTYIGFNPNTGLPSPVQQRIYVNSTPRVGLYGHLVGLEANVAGFNPLSSNNLTSITPSYNGYSSVVNYEEFFSGSEVQTDAEYRLDFTRTDKTSDKGTEDALLSALINETPSVLSAVVYFNPTQDFVYDVSNNLVCKPFTYNTVVLGGSDADIAQTILDVAPLNSQSYGETNTTVYNSLDKPRQIFFTKATYFDVLVSITYKARSNAVLTEVETTNLKNALIEYVESLDIGTDVLIEDLRSICYLNIPSSKRTGITIQLRDATGVGGFTDSDLIPDYKEKPRLTFSNITVNRTT